MLSCNERLRHSIGEILCNRYHAGNIIGGKYTLHIVMPSIRSNATLLKSTMITPTVVQLEYMMENLDFSFKPGQWVDFFGPSELVGEAIGGYSIVSTPSSLPRLTLAVKASRHPPAVYCHQAKVGDTIQMVAGGKFTLEIASSCKHLIFLAGGVGINPLYSMLQEWREMQDNGEYKDVKASLLYSAASESELAFMEDIKSLRLSSLPLFKVTKDPHSSFSQGRIGIEDIVSCMRYK